MQYVACHQARPLLDGLVDGELSMADQLVVESHLRWCDTCARRVEDMRIIGASLRVGSVNHKPAPALDQVLSAMTAGVLLRARAEREASFAVRVREMFTDMRLLWPALGATVAVAVCVSLAAVVLHASTAEEPDSLAGLISALGSPGSERNPLRPADNGISIPRVFEDDARKAVGTLERMPDDDVIYTVRTVVSRDGRISNFEVLLSNGEALDARGTAKLASRDRAVLDAIRQTRFAPAQTPLGRAVAVDMVWVIAKTTAVLGPPVALGTRSIEQPRKDLPKPVSDPPATPMSNQSETRRPSATA